MLVFRGLTLDIQLPILPLFTSRGFLPVLVLYSYLYITLYYSCIVLSTCSFKVSRYTLAQVPRGKREQQLRTRVGFRDAVQQFTLLLILYPALFLAALLYRIAV